MNIGYLRSRNPLPYSYVLDKLQLARQHTELTERLQDHLSEESSQLACMPQLEGPRMPYCFLGSSFFLLRFFMKTIGSTQNQCLSIVSFICSNYIQMHAFCMASETPC